MRCPDGRPVASSRSYVDNILPRARPLIQLQHVVLTRRKRYKGIGLRGLSTSGRYTILCIALSVGFTTFSLTLRRRDLSLVVNSGPHAALLYYCQARCAP